jgi:hypothetical protein
MDGCAPGIYGSLLRRAVTTHSCDFASESHSECLSDECYGETVLGDESISEMERDVNVDGRRSGVDAGTYTEAMTLMCHVGSACGGGGDERLLIQ